nr:hypothetical protein StreXyl84_65300 [Streptomyces sp. Xyl84]
MDHQQVLQQIGEESARTPGRGRSADYIPALAARDPRAFGMAVAELDGTVHGVGEWREPFSTRSITKVFTLALGRGAWVGNGRGRSSGGAVSCRGHGGDLCLPIPTVGALAAAAAGRIS